MDTKVKGIVLNCKDYKESDKLLSILSLEKGKITVVAKGVRKAKSKFKAYAQPFCFATFELTNSKTGGGFVLTGVEEIENFYFLTSDINKFEYAFCILEIANKICKEGELYAGLFLQILKSLQALIKGVNEKVVLIKYILSVLNFEGVNINLNKCTNCKSALVGEVYLDLQTCETLCSICKNLNCVKLEKSTFATLKIVSSSDFSNLNSLKLKENFLNDTLEILINTLLTKFEIRLKSILGF